MKKPLKRYKSWTLITSFLILLMVLYFTFNPSYEKSIEAKFYYSIGHYEKAYELSREAFELEPYNRMANSVMVQSKYALRYVNYNKEAKQYLLTIRKYASQDRISLADQLRIKMMCDIMIEKHEKMQPTVLIEKDLVLESQKYYEQFVKLHEKLVKAI